jgi:type IV pilus assembly protein PilN
LQGTRPIIVRTFDELVEVMPDGIHYQSLNRSGQEMVINGLAVANEDVSSLMRTLNDSIWFGEPSLSKVTTQNGLKSFNLRVPLERPNVEEAAQ